MIRLTRFDGKQFTLNAEFIMLVEETPDTVISLTSGQKFVVKESEQEIVTRVIEYKRKLAMVNRQETATGE